MTQFLSPFSIDIDPMSRLLLINFEKDPDTTYIGFEPQVFADSVHGKGHLIIGWRTDGKVDVYHEPTLTLLPDNYDIAGKGLKNMIECQFEVASFEINERGVRANYQFTDLQNRKISIRIDEQNPKSRKPFGLLAPMGDAAENPSAMPLVLLQDFYFVRRAKTDFEVVIDKQRHLPDKLPLPMDFSRMYFARYSAKPLIARLNPLTSGSISPVEVKHGATRVDHGNYTFDWEWKNDAIFLRKITRHNDTHPLSIAFENPFPDILSMENDTRANGKFSIEAHPTTGRITGRYSLEKTNDSIGVDMGFSGWKPRPSKLSLLFLYTVSGIFKKWPASYLWTAAIHPKNNGDFSMKSKWERI